MRSLKKKLKKNLKASRDWKKPGGRQPVSKRLAVDEHRSRPLCRVCFNLPWARTPERHGMQSAIVLTPVVNDNGLCLGCGRPYSPESEARRALLSSNAGQALAWSER